MTLKSANAIIIHNEKLLLLLRDNKKTIPNPSTWSLIGGEIDEGESKEEAMLREAEEEISVRPDSCEYLGILITPDNFRHAIFFIKLSDDEFKNLKLGDEGQKISFFTPEEIAGLELAKNLALYYEKYKKYLKEVIEAGKTPNPQKLGLS